jgi:hypothetical protein
MATRGEFIQKTALGAAGPTLGAKSYSRVMGANYMVYVGIVGYSDLFRGAMSPSLISPAVEKVVQY